MIVLLRVIPHTVRETDSFTGIIKGMVESEQRTPGRFLGIPSRLVHECTVQSSSFYEERGIKIL